MNAITSTNWLKKKITSAEIIIITSIKLKEKLLQLKGLLFTSSGDTLEYLKKKNPYTLWFSSQNFVTHPVFFLYTDTVSCLVKSS